jgi:hypothetical protein
MRFAGLSFLPVQWQADRQFGYQRPYSGLLKGILIIKYILANSKNQKLKS